MSTIVHIIIVGAQKILNFIVMELPITRKKYKNPRDFLPNISKPIMAEKLYTFHPPSLLTQSANKQQNDYSEANPELEGYGKGQRLQEQNSKQKQRIYFDAESSGVPDIQPSIKRNDSSQQNYEVGHQRQQEEEVCDMRARVSSGIIMKQRVKNSNMQQNLSRKASPQRQFNRLALSLLGIKRSKYNKSCLQKKSSFSIHEILTNSSHNHKSSRYTPTKNQEMDKNNSQIYRYSMYPFSVKKIEKIKEEVNRISGESRFRRNFGEKDKIWEREWNQEGQGQRQEKKIYSEIYSSRKDKQIRINIKTSLSTLKNLLSLSPPPNILIQLPQFFLKPPSQLLSAPNPNPQTLTNQCTQIFSSLGMPIPSSLTIRKYSNCVVIINHSISIVWHGGSEGKRYIGSWRNKYFDEGEKEGLGLEWAPGRYVYYGQFQGNKRNGFGVMRGADRTVLLGYWSNGKYMQFGIHKNV